MKSPKEISVDQKLIALTTEIIEMTEEKDQLPLLVIKELIEDPEIEAVQNYANNVSIVRLGYNDHGPVHMRTVCRNALKMIKILHLVEERKDTGINPSDFIYGQLIELNSANQLFDNELIEL